MDVAYSYRTSGWASSRAASPLSPARWQMRKTVVTTQHPADLSMGSVKTRPRASAPASVAWDVHSGLVGAALEAFSAILAESSKQILVFRLDAPTEHAPIAGFRPL